MNEVQIMMFATLNSNTKFRYFYRIKVLIFAYGMFS